MIEIPSLRPMIDGRPFPGTELPDIPTALAEAERWIDAGEVVEEVPTGRWNAWPDHPDFRPAYGPLSLNTGSAGVAWYAQQAALVLGKERHARRAWRAVSHIASSWHSHVDDRFLGIDGTGLGFYGGLAGIGSALLGIGRAERSAGESASGTAGRGPANGGGSADALAGELFGTIVERQGRTGGRPAGGTGVDALLGDGGIVLALLTAAERLARPDLRDAAVRAGDMILADERPLDDRASRWPGIPPEVVHQPAGTDVDGFELGHIGVTFVLARLASATGYARFRDAAGRASRAIGRSAVRVADSAVFRRMGGDYSFGYCTGSSGVIRAFVAVYQVTQDPEHLEWALRFGRGILRSGVPAPQTPGNHLVLHQCCGAAAVLESYLGLWAITGDRLWLEAARTQADDILLRSIHDAKGRRWYSRAEVLPTGVLKAEVGHQVGSSGIALALLRLHAYEVIADGGTTTVPMRLPDDPYPERPLLGGCVGCAWWGLSWGWVTHSRCGRSWGWVSGLCLVRPLAGG